MHEQVALLLHVGDQRPHHLLIQNHANVVREALCGREGNVRCPGRRRHTVVGGGQEKFVKCLK